MKDPRQDVVGSHEIVARARDELGAELRRETVNNWNFRRKQWEAAGRPARRARDEPMPAPITTVSGLDAWDWPEVAAWIKRTGKDQPAKKLAE
ncbi:hypothetical protein AB0F88_39930 [Streptosporangium sp. NPDC023963]|uniref:hypothetical protein n=1 Tax=Streptosporangium sp. NPDC023963 TaxID=3155608 RepID=UPI00341764AB